MALKFKIDKAEWDGLDEGIKKLYEEKDGSYRLMVDGTDDVSGLKSALASERKHASELEKTMRKWTETGKKPEEVMEMLKKAEEEELKRKQDKGEYDSIIAQLKESNAKELQTKDDSLKSMQTTLESYLIDAEAMRVLTECGGNTTLLLPHVKHFTKVVNVDGKYETRVIGEDGQPRVNAKGAYLTIKDLVEEMKQKEAFQCAFSAEGHSGGGAQGSGATGGGGTVINPFKKETWNLTEQYMLIKNSPSKAVALAKEAGVNLDLPTK